MRTGTRTLSNVAHEAGFRTWTRYSTDCPVEALAALKAEAQAIVDQIGTHPFGNLINMMSVRGYLER